MSRLTEAQKRVLACTAAPKTVRVIPFFFHTARQQKTLDALIEKGLVRWMECAVLTEEGEKVLGKIEKKALA